MMARAQSHKVGRRLVEPTRRPTSVGEIPTWVGQAFGAALILGDFVFGRRLVASFERFSDGGLSGVSDPFAWMMFFGVTGWWLVVLGWGWVGQVPGFPPTSVGVGVTGLVIALVTAVLLGEALGWISPVFRLATGEEPNSIGIAFLTGTMLALWGFQLWRLTAGDPRPPTDEGDEYRSEDAPETTGEGEAAVQNPPYRLPAPPRRVVRPGIRFVAALCLLPAGWVLLAPGDLLAIRAEEGIALNWPGLAGRLGAGALASVFSAGFGMLVGYGPRVLASRVLGEGLSGTRFFLGLWAAHFFRVVW